MVFWDTLRDLTFFNFMLAFCRKVRFWDPFKIQRVPRCHPNLHKSAILSNKCMSFSRPGGFYSRPVSPKLSGHPPCQFWTDFGSLLTPFLIDFGPYFVSFRFNLGSFQGRKVAIPVPLAPPKEGLVKMGRRNSRRDNNFNFFQSFEK